MPESRLKRLQCRQSAPLEVDTLVDGQAKQMTTEAVQSHLDRASADPVAVADQARLARHGADWLAMPMLTVPPVGPLWALVEIDQQGQRMAGAAVLAQLAADRWAASADTPLTPSSPGSRVTTPARNTFSAPGSVAIRAERCPPLNISAVASVWPRSPGPQHHAFQRLVVLGNDEVAEALPHFRLDRRRRA